MVTEHNFHPFDDVQEMKPNGNGTATQLFFLETFRRGPLFPIETTGPKSIYPHTAARYYFFLGCVNILIGHFGRITDQRRDKIGAPVFISQKKLTQIPIIFVTKL